MFPEQTIRTCDQPSLRGMTLRDWNFLKGLSIKFYLTGSRGCDSVSGPPSDSQWYTSKMIDFFCEYSVDNLKCLQYDGFSYPIPQSNITWDSNVFINLQKNNIQIIMVNNIPKRWFVQSWLFIKNRHIYDTYPKKDRKLLWDAGNSFFDLLHDYPKLKYDLVENRTIDMGGIFLPDI